MCSKFAQEILKNAYLLGFFPLGVLELLPLLGDLEPLLSVGDPGKLICNTLAETGEAGEPGLSGDLEQERIYYKHNAKCT